MSEDLYVLLDVSRDVDANGLRWAYERKLAEASRLGALRRADPRARRDPLAATRRDRRAWGARR